VVKETLEDRAREFALVMEHGTEALRQEIGYDPSRWVQMVRRYGAVDAAKRLLASGGDTSAGLATLTMAGRLDQSVEWFVLVYADLFEPEERQIAHRRLRLHDAPVDRWLRERLGRRSP
jgi:hypothetical protein